MHCMENMRVLPNKLLFGLLLVVLVLIGCQPPKNTPFLSVALDEVCPETIWLSYLDESFQVIDSTKVNDKGLFEFYADSVPNGIYRLDLKGISIHVIIDQPFPILIESSTRRFRENAKFYGSDLSSVLLSIEQHCEALNNEIAQEVKVLKDSLSYDEKIKLKLQVLKKVEDLKRLKRKEIDQALLKNPDGLLAMLALHQSAGNYALYEPKQNVGIYKKVAEQLQGKWANYPPAKYFIRATDSLIQWNSFTSVTSPGKKMIEPGAPNAWGEPVLLSQFRGKPVLVIVWASTSIPSREKNKNLLRTVQPFRKKGLEVYMVSMDKDAKQWRKAIKEDRLPFWHTCDLKGEHSEVWQRLGIEQVPASFVIDGEGIIVDRNVWDDRLKSILSEITEK